MIDVLVHVFRSPEIKTTTHLALMLAIARRCGDMNGVCYAKQTTLAADTRLHAKTVAKAIGELEQAGLILKVKGETNRAGQRGTDHLYLTLKAVTLPETGPETKGSPARGPGSPVLQTGESLTPSPPRTGLPLKRPLEETLEDEDARSAHDANEEPDLDFGMIVELIWRSVGDKGRKRSSKAQIDKAIRAALARRPKGVGAEDHLKRILVGYRAYLSSPEARRDDGGFERGAHRMLENDRWEAWVDGDEPVPADRLPIDPEIGTDEAPGIRLQMLWAELAQQGMPWNEERGPRPGRRGCRISADIQRQYGFVPYAEPQQVFLSHNPVESVSDVFIGDERAVVVEDEDATAFL